VDPVVENGVKGNGCDGTMKMIDFMNITLRKVGQLL
jgi:hypothetical protein